MEKSKEEVTDSTCNSEEVLFVYLEKHFRDIWNEEIY